MLHALICGSLVGAPPSRPCVEFEAVVPVIAERLLCRPDQREYQVRRALGSMAGDGKIYQMRDGWIWANQPSHNVHDLGTDSSSEQCSTRSRSGK